MKIKVAEKVNVGKVKLVDDVNDKQRLHEEEEEQQEDTGSTCRRPAYGWCGQWKLTAVVVVVTLLSCQAWVILYCMKMRGDFHFPSVTHFVHTNTHGKTHRGKFSWSNCGDKSDPAQVTKLEVLPDPVNLNKDVLLTLNSYLDFNVSSPVKVVVKVQRKVLFFWVTVPCAFDLGSCTYQDVCKLTPFPGPAPCPEPFPTLKLPCRCPLQKGTYDVRDGLIDLSVLSGFIPSWLVSGYYHIHGVGYNQGIRLGCYEMFVSVD